MSGKLRSVPYFWSWILIVQLWFQVSQYLAQNFDLFANDFTFCFEFE